MAVAELGYKIDSSGVVKAEGDLDGMTAAAIRAEKGAKGVGAAAQTAGKKSFFAGSGFRNMALQLNQVGQQTAASGDLLRSFTIQLPDLLLGFGTIGIAAGALAPLMVGLGSSFLSAGGDVRDLEERIDDLNDALDDYQSVSDAASMSTVELTKNYGSASSTMRSTLDLLQQIAATNAQEALDGVSQSFADMFGVAGEGEARSAVADFFGADIFLAFNDAQREARSEARQLTAEFVGQQEALSNATGNAEKQRDILVEMVKTVAALADFDGVRSGEEREILKSLSDQIIAAERLAAMQAEQSRGRVANIAAMAAAAIDQSEAASDIIQKYNQQAALSVVIARYGKESIQYETAKRDAAMGVAEQYIRQNNLSGDVAQSVRDAAANAWDAESATNSWAASMTGVRAELNAIAAIIASLGGGAITAAAKQTEIAALRAGNTIKQSAVAAAEFKQNLKIDAQVAGLESRFGRVGTIIGGFVRGQAEYNRELDRTLETEREAAIQREKAAASGGKRGGGRGKRGGGVDVYQRDLDALLTSLRTERETVDLWYSESQTILADRRSMELLTAAEHNEAKLRLEQEYQERLSGIEVAGIRNRTSDALDGASQMFGALGSISEKALKAQAVTAAGSAWISTMVGAAKELEKGTFGFATALAVISKGAAFVAAIKSAGSGGSASVSGGSVSAAPSATTTAAAPQTRAIVQIQSGRSSFTVEEINEIIAGIQEEVGDGAIIEGFTRA